MNPPNGGNLTWKWNFKKSWLHTYLTLSCKHKIGNSLGFWNYSTAFLNVTEWLFNSFNMIFNDIKVIISVSYKYTHQLKAEVL